MKWNKYSSPFRAFSRGLCLALLLAVIAVIAVVLSRSVYPGFGLPAYPTLLTAIFAGFLIGALSSFGKLATRIPALLLITCTAIALPVAGCLLATQWVGPHLYPDPIRPPYSHGNSTAQDIHEEIEDLYERIETTTEYREQCMAIGEKRNALEVPGLIAGSVLSALMLFGLLLLGARKKDKPKVSGEPKQNQSLNPSGNGGRDLE